MFDATPIMRGYAALRYVELGAMDPVCAQQAILNGLIRRGASTRFGQDHGFHAIRTVENFQVSVPLRRYEDFHREY
jgi:hypothetical protein